MMPSPVFRRAFVGIFSATGYGAFLFAVRLFDNRAKRWFVRGFNSAGLVNLAIMLYTGKSFDGFVAGGSAAPLGYYDIAGYVVWAGFALSLLMCVCVSEVGKRFAEHDALVASTRRAAPR